MYDFESFLKVFFQKEAAGEFDTFDILKNKNFNSMAPITVLSSKFLSLMCQEYLYENIRKFVFNT